MSQDAESELVASYLIEKKHINNCSSFDLIIVSLFPLDATRPSSSLLVQNADAFRSDGTFALLDRVERGHAGRHTEISRNRLVYRN